MERSAGYDSDVGSKVISEVVLLVMLHTSYLWISRTLDCRVECSKKEMRLEWERSVRRILKDREDTEGQGGYRTGRIQDREDTGQGGYRTGRILKDREDTGQGGYRTGRIHDREDTGQGGY
jgi:hypothetical protein